MMLNEDYRDMLLALSAAKAKFLVVGAYAMAYHGYPRATQDIDIWVRPSAENADAVMRSLIAFGAPLYDLTTADLQRKDTIFQIGVVPNRIDIITQVSGVEFDEAYNSSVVVNMEGVEVRIPSMDDLIKNKKASGRTKDLADVEKLENLKNST